MASFDREIIEQVVAACQAGQGEAALAFRRTFDGAAELTVGESGAFNVDQLPAEFGGAGLILALRVGTESALVVLPESGGLVPAWCRQPDTTGKGKLATLAVELGMLLLPESFSTTDGTARYVRDLGAAMRRAGFSANAARVAIQVQSGTESGILSLIWPASQADAALNELVAAEAEPTRSDTATAAASPIDQATTPSANPAQPSATAAEDQTAAAMMPKSANQATEHESSAAAAATPPPSSPRRPKIEYEELEDGIAQLPSYSRSLLKIKVPVMVTLAESKQPVQNVLDIGPGSIIHFNKPCEDTLALEISGQKVALGEAVKVGDKFGLWITSMILPEERFWILSNRAGIERAK